MFDIFVTKVYADVIGPVTIGNLLPDYLPIYTIAGLTAMMLAILIPTVCIEYVALRIIGELRSFDKKKVFRTVLIMNLISNPMINIFNTFLSRIETSDHGPIVPLFFLLETLVVLFEAYYLKKSLSIKFVTSVIYSILLNVSSFIIGALVLYLPLAVLLFPSPPIVPPTSIPETIVNF